MRRQWKLVVLTVAGALLSAGAIVFAADSPDKDAAPRSRVFKFRNISSRQAQDVLTQLKIGSDYNPLTADVLIVTGRAGMDLVKASQVLELLDRKEAPELRTLMVQTETEPLPNPEVFAARLKTITVGTLLEGPPSSVARPAIIDVVDNKLIAIAPAGVLGEIETGLEEWKKEQAALKQAAIPAAPTQIAAPAEVPAPAMAEPNQMAAPAPAAPVEEVKQEQDAGIAEDATAKPSLTVPPDEERPSLEEVAGQLFGETADVNTVAAPATTEDLDLDRLPQIEPNQMQAETAESFMEDELLKTLADAEKKAQEQQTAAEAPAVTAAPAPPQVSPPLEPAGPSLEEQRAQALERARQAAGEPSEQAPPVKDEESEKLLLQMMQKAQQEQEKEYQEQQEEAAELGKTTEPPVVMEKEPAETPVEPTTEPAQTPEPLKAELDGLREQLARLEQMLAERNVEPQAADELPPKPQVPLEISPELAEKEIETTMDLPQEIDLENLIDLVGKQLGLNYLYDKTILQNQKVQLKVHGGKIKVGETYALLESVLRFKGFVMTRRDGFVTILRKQDMPQAEPALREPGDPIPAGDIIVSTVFHLNHVDVNSAENMLKGMNLGTTFAKVPETNTLIVTDYSYRMGQIRQVLEMIDVKGELKEYKFRTLNYLKPSELVPKLKDLAGQLQGVNLQISTPAAAAAPAPTRTVTTRDPQTGRTITQQVPTASVTPSAQTGGAAQPDAVYIDTDDRTNRILIAGKAAQIKLVNELIDALDVPLYDLKYVREYIIQYVEAIEVVNVLNGLGLASVNVSTPTAGTNQQQTGGRMSAMQARQAAQQAAQQPQPQPVAMQQASAGQTGAPEQPYVAIRPATNSLLVNATAEQHKSIELVIAHVDVIQKDQRTIRQYEIQHVDTQEIMDTLADLGIVAPDQAQTSSSAYDSQRGGYGRNSSGRSTQQQQMMQQQQQMQTAEGAMSMALPTAEGGSEVSITSEQPQIAVLRATNSLLVFATPRQHDAIALVIAHADRVPDLPTTPYVVYALENQDPLELAEVLTKLIGETKEMAQQQPSGPDAKIQTASVAQAAPSIPTLEEEQITIVPDEMSYSLIVYANKRNQQWVSELIKELDEYRPQVLLDCTLVQITKDDQFQYSIDMVAKTYDGDSLQPATPIDPIGTPFSPGKTLADAGTVGGNITAFLNTGSVQAILRAMQEKGFGRVMSQPKLLVNDNQEGEIKSETKTSIAQKKTIIQPGSDVGNTITTEDVTFAEYSSGVTLKIKPHISKGDMLRLEITLTRADFRLQPDVTVGTSGTFPRPPDILSTDVTSVATVPDGTTIVLGGLESVTQNKSQTKVPILGDIPLLGALFRSVDDTDEQSKLYVFLKANVIRPGDQIGGLKDIRRVSNKYRQEFEEMESKFQRQDDIPGWKPQPLEPEKVLEADEEADEQYLDNLEQRLQEMDLEKSSAQ